MSDLGEQSTRARTSPEMPAAVAAQIEEHAASSHDREIGGFLVGTWHDGSTRVTAAIPALRAESSAANVTFTHEVWSDVLATVESEYPEDRIVGWYHSHPGFGVFLSAYDTFIQENFFSDPRMVALVVDPLAGTAGWFMWRDGAIEPQPEFRTQAPPVPPAEAESGADRGRRLGQTILMAIGLCVVAGATGFWLGGNSAQEQQEPTPQSSEALQRQADEHRREVAQLEEELETAHSEVRAAKSNGTGSIRYTIQPGDHWWRIAEAFYGDGSNYRALRRRNPSVAMEPGQVVIIHNPRTSNEGTSTPTTP